MSIPAGVERHCWKEAGVIEIIHVAGKLIVKAAYILIYFLTAKLFVASVTIKHSNSLHSY